jgi:hypothetical protein
MDTLITTTDNVIKPLVKGKVVKKTQLVLDSMNEYINTFRDGLDNINDFHFKWNDTDNQLKFRQFIYEKKICMKNPFKAEELAKIKMEKKEKREEKAKKREEEKVQKQQERPKSAYFFFRNDEVIVVKVEHPDFNKKDIHNELQKRWKEIRSKNVERYNYYKEIADKEALNKVIPVKEVKENKKEKKKIKLEETKKYKEMYKSKQATKKVEKNKEKYNKNKIKKEMPQKLIEVKN